MKLLLSVIIPTYKRLERLKKTFPLIVEEVSNEIEFIILDNASEDDYRFSAIVKEIVKSAPFRMKQAAGAEGQIAANIER